MKFGKLPRRSDYRTLRFSDYAAALPPPPPAVSNINRAVRALTNQVAQASVQTLFPMDANDQYGDCVIAGLAHAETIFAAFAGQTDIMRADQAMHLYLQLTGGQDSGLVELDTLKWWRKHNLTNDRLVAFVSVRPSNLTHVKQAIQMFGGIFIGFQVQQACLSDFNAHRPWQPGPLTQDGHAVWVGDYDDAAKMFTVLTWGSSQLGSYAWWTETVDECYALLPPEAQIAGWAPTFDYQALKADLNRVAG